MPSLGTFVVDLFKKLEGFFTSGKAAKVAEEVAHLTQLAAPIVADISAMVPNKTLAEVTLAYEKYGVPLANQIIANPSNTAIENAMQNLAVNLLQKNHAPTAAISLLNTAVNLAVVATK